LSSFRPSSCAAPGAPSQSKKPLSDNGLIDDYGHKKHLQFVNFLRRYQSNFHPGKAGRDRLKWRGEKENGARHRMNAEVVVRRLCLFQLPGEVINRRRNTMKKQHLFKSGCSILIAAVGVLAPLTSAHALDLLDRIRLEHLGGGWSSDTQSTMRTDAAPPSQYGNQGTPQGAEGPIRSDMSTDQSAAQKAEDYNRDIQRRLGPVGGVGTP
jgi:hypothetical protein